MDAGKVVKVLALPRYVKRCQPSHRLSRRSDVGSGAARRPYTFLRTAEECKEAPETIDDTMPCAFMQLY